MRTAWPRRQVVGQGEAREARGGRAGGRSGSRPTPAPARGRGESWPVAASVSSPSPAGPRRKPRSRKWVPVRKRSRGPCRHPLGGEGEAGPEEGEEDEDEGADEGVHGIGDDPQMGLLGVPQLGRQPHDPLHGEHEDDPGGRGVQVPAHVLQELQGRVHELLGDHAEDRPVLGPGPGDERLQPGEDGDVVGERRPIPSLLMMVAPVTPSSRNPERISSSFSGSLMTATRRRVGGALIRAGRRWLR